MTLEEFRLGILREKHRREQEKKNKEELQRREERKEHFAIVSRFWTYWRHNGKRGR